MCSLTVTSVRGSLSSTGDLSVIIVEGTATDCDEVVVTIRCTGNDVIKTATVDSATGTWSVEFASADNVAGAECQCDGQIDIHLECATDPSCTADYSLDLPCEEPGQDCPEIDIHDPVIGDCNSEGKRPVTVTATVTPGSSGWASVQFFHDGGYGLSDVVYPPGATITDTADYTGDGAVHTVTVEVLGPPGCPGESLTFTVPECEEGDSSGCPTISWTIPDISDDCTEDGKRVVTLSATVTSTASGYLSAQLLRDGTQVDSDSSSAGSVSLSATIELDPGPHVATVEILSPSGCPSGDLSFEVDECPNGGEDDVPDDDVENGNGDGGDGGSSSGESLPCAIARGLSAVAAAIALLSLLLVACVPAAKSALLAIAAAAAAVSVIAGAIYSILCPSKQCKWFLLLLAQALLGAGLGAAILSACCPWMLGVGLLLAFFGLMFLGMWRQLCNKNWCDVAREMTLIIGGVVLPIVGMVAAIPLVASCVDMTILGIVSAASGLIAVYAVSCTPSGP